MSRCAKRKTCIAWGPVQAEILGMQAYWSLYSVSLPQSSDDSICFPGSEMPHIHPLQGCMLLHGHWHEIRHSREYSWLSCWHARLLQTDLSCRPDTQNAKLRKLCETSDNVLTCTAGCAGQLSRCPSMGKSHGGSPLASPTRFSLDAARAGQAPRSPS